MSLMRVFLALLTTLSVDICYVYQHLFKGTLQNIINYNLPRWSLFVLKLVMYSGVR